MNLLTNRIILKRTGLLLLVILFFLGCRKEKNKIGLNDPDRLPVNTYFTDTITIKSEVILVNDSINTMNVSSDGINSLLMAGAYKDPLLGTVEVKGYTQLSLKFPNVELPAAVVDSAYLYLSYSYYYGDTTSPQSLYIHKLTEKVKKHGHKYFSNSSLTYDPTPIGAQVGFYASGDSAVTLKIKITDMAYLQSILDASKNNDAFHNQIYGLALVPGNSTDGAILRIDGASAATSFKIYYTQYGVAGKYTLTLGSESKKFFGVTADRTNTNPGAPDISSLVNNYDKINTTDLNNKGYIQSLTSLRTRLTFPYLKKLREAYPNMAIVSASLSLAADPDVVMSNVDKYKINSGLVLMRTEKTGDGLGYKVMRDANNATFYVQPDDYTQTTNGSVLVITPTDRKYTFPIRSYVQAILLDQIPNDPIIVSPSLIYTQANRVIFNDNSGNGPKPLKLNIYFTTTK